MRKIQWGVISTGDIAGQFASDIQFAEAGEALAVSSRTLEKAEAFGREHGIPRAYDDYEALMADPDIDAVYIGTPHTFHRPIAEAAIAAGKAVLCEKPLTTNAGDTRAVVDAARRAGVYLMEGMWTWHLPAIRHAHQWVLDGRIGELKHIRAEFGFSMLPYDPDKRVYNKDLGGGCMLDLGIYPIALCRLFFQNAPERILPLARFAPNGVEDAVECIAQFPGDALASLGASFRATLQNHAVLSGSEGIIVIPEFFRARECFLLRNGERVDAFHDGRDSLGYAFQIQAASIDIREGRRESAVVRHADSIAFQEQVDAVLERCRS